MKTIEQLAREAGVDAEEADTPAAYKTPWFSCTAEELQRFAELVIAQYREGLLAGGGEPQKIEQTDQYGDAYGYTADQIAAAVLRGVDKEHSRWIPKYEAAQKCISEWIAEHAKLNRQCSIDTAKAVSEAEQRMKERCADVCEERANGDNDAQWCADYIRGLE